MWLKTLGWGDYTEFFQWAHYNLKDLYRVQEKAGILNAWVCQDVRKINGHCWLWRWKGIHKSRNEGSLLRAARKQTSYWSLNKIIQVWYTLVLASEMNFGILTSRTVRTGWYCFKLYHLCDNLSHQQWGIQHEPIYWDLILITVFFYYEISI